MLRNILNMTCKQVNCKNCPFKDDLFCGIMSYWLDADITFRDALEYLKSYIVHIEQENN